MSTASVEWPQKFKDLSIRPPEWYQGYDACSCNSVVFVNSLNSSISSFQSSARPVTSTTSALVFTLGLAVGFQEAVEEEGEEGASKNIKYQKSNIKYKNSKVKDYFFW